MNRKNCKNCGHLWAHKTGGEGIGCGGHLFHFVLTICTGLLWGIVWILHANYDDSKYHCANCGGKVK